MQIKFQVGSLTLSMGIWYSIKDSPGGLETIDHVEIPPSNTEKTTQTLFLGCQMRNTDGGIGVVTGFDYVSKRFKVHVRWFSGKYEYVAIERILSKEILFVPGSYDQQW